MKRVFTCLLAGILFSNHITSAVAEDTIQIAAPEPAVCVPPPAGIVGWWPGEGNANDVVGTNNGILSATGASYASGEVGQAFRFDGVSGCVQLPDSPTLKPANFTLEAWVWLDPNIVPGPGGESILFTKNSSSAYFEGYNLNKQTVANGDGTYTDHFSCVISRNGDQVILNSITAVQRGVWYHVAATYDGNTLTLFVNGVAESSTVAGFALDYGDTPVFIGASGQPSPYSAFFGGIIDEASIYNRALATNEIAAIYNAGSAGKCQPVHQCVPPPAGIVGWWPGEGNVNDIIGGDNGTLSDSGAGYAAGEVGQGFRLDGTNGYVQIPDSAALKPTNVTAEAWVWLDPNTSFTAGEYIIFKKNTQSGLFEGYALTQYQNHFQFVASRNGNQVIATSTTLAQRGVWYHVAGTYDGNTLTIYVNGVAEDSAVAGFDLDYDTQPVFFGTSGQPAPNRGMLGGIIDEASIYNRALSSNEIAAIYAAGSAGKCTNEPILPFIATPPASQSVAEGGEVDLSVLAGGAGTLSYQWTFNGSIILGATSDALTLANIHPDQAGAYAVKVSNAGGSVTSSPAVVTVIAHNILVYSYSGSEAVTTLGSEASYNISGQLFFIPDTTNATFVGWAKINGKRQYWVDQVSDYLLINIPGSNNRSYTVLGKAGSGIDGNGQPHLWSLLHTGQNANLHIGTRTYYSFPNTFAFSGTQIYPAEQTGDMVLREEASGYTFMQNNTQAANNTGQTVTDLVSALVQSLVRQGYQPK